MSQKQSQNSLLKIPVILTDFKYRKMSNSWDITFELQPENLEMGKTLMDCMGEHFVLIPVKVENPEEMKEALGIEAVKLDA